MRLSVKPLCAAAGNAGPGDFEMVPPKTIPLADYRRLPVEEMQRRAAAFYAEMRRRRSVRAFSDDHQA